jgi:hypothetical protein
MDLLEAKIHERRSAMIQLIMESANALAASCDKTGIRTEVKNTVGFHCWNIGMTFHATAAAIDQLKEMKVYRGIGENQWTKGGGVEVFNLPQHMFRESHPRLAGAENWRKTPDGITFHWELRATFANPAPPCGDNPEFHLKHYRIERVVRTEGKEYRWVFESKTSAAWQEDGGRRHLRKPSIQFIDDFRKPAELPEPLRDVILEKGLRFLDHQIPNTYDWQADKIEVHYRIYAVDCAGTSDPGTAVDVRVKPRKPALIDMVDAYCRFEFQDMPASGGIEPKTKFDFTVGQDCNEEKRFFEFFEIRVLEDQPIPSGQYGGDALSTALSSTTIAEIEKRGTPFRFQMGPDGYDVWIRFVEVKDGRPKSADKVGKAQIVKKDNFGSYETFKSLCTTPGKTLRFFIRRLTTDEEGIDRFSNWRAMQVQIAIGNSKSGTDEVESTDKAEKPKIVDANLETYEYPIQFHYDPIRREDFTVAEAGRLHTIVPDCKGLWNGVSSITHPAIDPKRRSGIRLRWRSRAGRAHGLAGSDAWRMTGGFRLWEVTHGNPAFPIEVALLPKSARGLEPDTMGDLSLIEAHYPSCKGQASEGRSRPESQPLFPEWPHRRSLMPLVDGECPEFR